MVQQCLGRLLGAVNYEKFPSCLEPTIKTLLNGVDRSVTISLAFPAEVDVRCSRALSEVMLRHGEIAIKQCL